MLWNGFHGLVLGRPSLRNFHLFVWVEIRQVCCTLGSCNFSNNVGFPMPQMCLVLLAFLDILQPQQAHHSTFRGFRSIFERISLSRSTVTMFHSKVNPTTGKLEWCAPEEGDSDLQEDSDISKELFR